MTGLSNLIINYDSLKEKKEKDFLDRYIIPTSNKDIYVIPTGPTPPNPVELLGSNQIEKIMKDLREIFDVILLDCPPVLGLSDTLIMTKYSDSNIVVTACKETKTESLKQIVKSFEQANAKITGVIFNKVNLKDNHYYSYYSKDYYGHKVEE